MAAQKSLKDEALESNFPDKLVCIECGKKIKDYRSLRCRPCYIQFFPELSPFVKGFSNDKNGMWKGDKVSYNGVHAWVRKYKPKPEVCEICGIKEPKQIANISGEYKRDINDYQWLCTKCHVIKDGTINNLKPYNKIHNKGGLKS